MEDKSSTTPSQKKAAKDSGTKAVKTAGASRTPVPAAAKPTPSKGATVTGSSMPNKGKSSTKPPKSSAGRNTLSKPTTSAQSFPNEGTIPANTMEARQSVDERIDRLEKLVEKLVSREADSAIATRAGPSQTSSDTYSYDGSAPPPCQDEGQWTYGDEYSLQSETDSYNPEIQEYYENYDISSEMGEHTRLPDMPEHFTQRQSQMPQGQGNAKDLSKASREEPPPLAARFAAAPGTGKSFMTDLGSSIDYMLTHKLDDKSLEDTAEKYITPDNCEALSVPKVNLTIWENLKSTTRAKDARLQKVQKALIRGITAFARSVDGTQLSDTQQDALALLSSANYELNCVRKELIRPEINPKYAHLCKASTQTSKLLFGDDLSKQVKELQEEQKAAVGVVRTGPKFQYRSRDRGAYRPYPYANQSRYRDAGWSSRQGQTHRSFLGAGMRGTPQWKKRGSSAPHTQSRPPPTQDGKNTGRDRPTH